MIVVVNDMMNPSEDVVREGGVDDPIGGPLDGAPEAWSLRLVSAGADSAPTFTRSASGSVVYGPVDGFDRHPTPSPRRALPDDAGPDEGELDKPR
jgi:hypothetical protein